jgi:ribonuclease HI
VHWRERVKALLRLIGQYGPLEAEIRCDSELVVRQFNRAYKIKHPDLINIAGQTWNNLEKNPTLKIKVVHVPREENKLADAAVNQELDKQKNKQV